jgi:hypothetical protein
MTPEQFTKSSVTAVASLGLFFVGMPDQTMAVALRRVRSSLETSLADSWGIEAATEFAQAFVEAVVGHRNEISGSSTMSRRYH